MYKDIYRGKKVLVTGHTGFKGTWLTTWLLSLGAEVFGYSDGIPTTPSLFVEAKMQDKVDHTLGDIRDLAFLTSTIDRIQPDFIFHLAAQAIVSASYENPIDTLTTNICGTANILEALRVLDRPCIAVIITSDKCYENIEWLWGYKETDSLGGKDIYSASKGAAEQVFHAFHCSYFHSSDSNVRLVSARAGNVIGGGDWAKDRIVVDCMKSWSASERVEIRCPDATRPWQHVLEPLSGYLTLGAALADDIGLQGESFNFGPKPGVSKTVRDVIHDLSYTWNFSSPDDAYRVVERRAFNEAGLLKLNCEKALFALDWEASLEYEECVRLVGEWYYNYYVKNEDPLALTLAQIKLYESVAAAANQVWTR